MDTTTGPVDVPVSKSRPASGASSPTPFTHKGITFGYLDPKLEIMLTHALEFIADSPAKTDPTFGLIAEMRRCLEGETDPVRKQHMVGLLNDLKTYLAAPSHDDLRSNDGQILILVSPDGLNARLTVTPPRGGGSMPTINKILAALNKCRIKHGIDMDVVNRALEVVRQPSNDVVWQALFAAGAPAIPGAPQRIEFNVRVIDKQRLRANIGGVAEQFDKHWDPVSEGDVIGQLLAPREGVPGKDVYGEAVMPPDPVSAPLEFGDGVILYRNGVNAQTGGYVVVDGSRVDVVPMYIMQNPSPESVRDFSFPGALLVRGNLQGPASVECEDLYVLGNCEQMTINSCGDVFVAGGVIGHNQGVIDTDGCFQASFISEARVTALGEIAVANAIINSHVTSNNRIVVTSDKGMIAGGHVLALCGITVQTIGSEFGLLTETQVGKDFLTTQRLAGIVEKIRIHEENLRRIQELKLQISKSRVRIDDLPPEKQEIYIGVLRKETQSQAELRSLSRRKAKLSQQLQAFLSASVKALDGIFPPVRIQIVDEIKEINNRLNAVTLQYDSERGIVASYLQKGTDNS